MRTKILVNGITLVYSNIVPLLSKIKYWQRKRIEITFFGNNALKKQIDSLKIVKKYNFIELKNTKRVRYKIYLIFEYLKRNLLALPFVFRFRHKFDVVYSSSSVLDCLIFGYLLKKADKKIKWAAVFDNIVPISDPGNRVLRFLAWFFFRISLILLKKTDKIFVISLSLLDFLLKEGFRRDQIEVTANGIENELIRKAKKNNRYKIDALFVGRINETKGIYDMLKVLNIVQKEYPYFQFAVMGEGDEVTNKQFRGKIKEMGLLNNVQFLGYRNGLEKFNIIKSSKCFWFLSVSESESFGIALLEAVASGKPAFVYDLPAYQYYKNGEVFRFRIHDYASVADKVIDIFDKKEFDNKKGKLLLGKYDWEKIAAIELNCML